MDFYVGDAVTSDPPRPLRRWQAEAIPLIVEAFRAREQGLLVSAVMGAGKSILISELCRLARGEVLVTVPTRRLVEQTAGVAHDWLGEGVGMWYTSEHTRGRVTIVCDDSMSDYLDQHPGPPRLWIVDEAHRSESPTMLAAADRLGDVPRLGLTATAYRATERERLSLWTRVVYRYTLADALRDGVLVPWRVVPWDGRGDAQDVDGIVVRMLGAAEGPGVVGCLGIDDAEEYASTLTAAGLPALPIHSRQRPSEQRAAMDALRTGSIRALCHVDMLSEGVDLPWLRWIALRAPIGSRVRFIQTIGRVLRSSEGKAHATLYDPHDLFGAHSLAHPEALGKALDEDGGERPGPGGDPEVREMPPARAVDDLSGWTRQLVGALQAAGLVDVLPSEWWRSATPTERQVALLRGMGRVVGEIPSTERAAIRAMVEHADGLRRGAASDLLTVLGAVRRLAGPLRQKRIATGRHYDYRWAWPIPVPPPPGDAVSALAKRPRVR